MHVVALERGTPGERYILGGENLTLKQILDRMSAITGLPSPTMKVPHAVAMVFAFLDETITGKMLGKEPRATGEAIRVRKKFPQAPVWSTTATSRWSLTRRKSLQQRKLWSSEMPKIYPTTTSARSGWRRKPLRCGRGPGPRLQLIAD